MAKELPYFRFTASEWLNDDISLESYDLKGLFADVCAFYWFKDCSIGLALLEKRFRSANEMLMQLIDIGIIKLNDDNSITIKFLDEQYDMLSEKRKKRSEAGRRGGLAKSSNAKANVKQCSSYKDKDKDKDNYKELEGDKPPSPKKSIQELCLIRESKFKEDVNAFTDYDSQTLNAFFNYWSEPNKSKSKMLWETKPTFDIKRRLATWASKSFNNTSNGTNRKNSGFVQGETKQEAVERGILERFENLGKGSGAN